ncbi:thiamine pyrophosphate-binding protein [Azohydromonas sediminis]|uniref:thiamine pyrophosphate-binding protein n=1 Tax=Azohydromonas sediminis TaxID=2259674 RepID=UPI000E64AE2C|nr:thiamine pyrophosphate-binding protein [Azohydromonas sediminis]
MTAPTRITVGELAARFLEACGVRAAFGVISIHNMPILDALHTRRKIRFVSARGEAGACNMADAYARVSATLGVCVTSTGTGCGNAAGAMVEALTAGTPLLHLTGQIESPYLDRDLGYIHEHPAQLAMLKAVGKEAFRVRNPETALATLREAVRLAHTPPCGPVSVEIPIDVQKATLELPPDLSPLAVPPVVPSAAAVDALAERLASAKRPLLWLGGGARGAGAAVRRLVDMGFAVVTSVQGRGIVPEDHPRTLAAYNLHKAAEHFYETVDAMLVVGSRLRSNETLTYKLRLPGRRFRVDANALADQRGYGSEFFVHGDAQLTLDALADRLQGRLKVDPRLADDVQRARRQAACDVDATLGPYVELKNAIGDVVGRKLWWVRDITLSNSMWGNRAPVLDHPRAGVHALGGGIGQGLAMGVGAAVANHEHALGRKTVALCGDGGFMLNVGELACAAQEKADVLFIVMNDRRYGVIKNIQDELYGGRHAYVELRTPDFAQLCASLQVPYLAMPRPGTAKATLERALATPGPVVIEVDMAAWGPFAAKFAGPPKQAQ